MAEKLYGATVSTKRNSRDSEYWDTDLIVKRIRAPKSKRADRNDWRRNINCESED